jgi:DNA processing protein
VAVIGARNASALGLRLAEMLARELGAAGWTVVSGMARGIDAAAHQGALETGTVAALAGGADVVYPPQNAGLHAAVAAQGLLLSEAPMGEAPQARHFPRRNRIVSGLSRGVVLIEAAERSGSLITARLALEQGREVMAAPGSPLDPRAAGCNALIRDGATLVRGAQDVIEALAAPVAPRPSADLFAPAAAPPPRPQRAPPPGQDGRIKDAAEARGGDPAARVLDLLGPDPVAFDDLARAAAMPAAALSALLTELEMEGRIDRRPGDLIATT